MTNEERNRIISCADEWRAFASAMGWKLYGFSDDYSATFFDCRNREVRLTGQQRDDILRAIASAEVLIEG